MCIRDSIKGIGGSYVYLVDRYGDKSIYDIDFDPVENAAHEEQANSLGSVSYTHLDVYKRQRKNTHSKTK